MALEERRHHGNPLTRNFWNEIINKENNIPTFLREAEIFPAINIIEQLTGYTIEFGVPGYLLEDFSFEIQHNILFVHAHTSERASTQKKNFSQKEFTRHSFERSFNLPEDANTAQIESSLQNGIYQIKIPKQKNGTPK